MTHAISIPKLGLTMEDAVVVEWTRADGERVAKGETVITIETDKIMFDVEAEQDGFVQRVAAVGAKVLVGELAGYLHPNAEAALAASRAGSAPAPTKPAAAATSASAPPAAASLPASAPAAPAPAAAPEPTAHPATLHAGTDATGQRRMVSPVARQLAKTRKLDLASIAGSGPGGVVLKRDVEGFVPSAAQRPPALAGAAAPAAPGRRPLSSMRKAIAKRMAHSLSSKAQMTGFGRIDMAEATKLRQSLVAAEQQLGARITYTDIVLKAAATVLGGMPEINSYIDGDDIVTWSEVNIGLAVSVDGGLMVPVIRNVDRLNLVELSLARQALIAKAREGKLTRDDVDGGTFTLSNFGSYGGDFETPILNAPQSALLGIGQIADEAVVRDMQIVIRPMMSISMTFDHALIDGALAGEFRARFKTLMEQPGLLLAQLR